MLIYQEMLFELMKNEVEIENKKQEKIDLEKDLEMSKLKQENKELKNTVESLNEMIQKIGGIKDI